MAANFPAEQLEQLAATSARRPRISAAPSLPATQSLHCRLPRAGWYWPGTQSVQAAEPSDVVFCPAAHSTHAEVIDVCAVTSPVPSFPATRRVHKSTGLELYVRVNYQITYDSKDAHLNSRCKKVFCLSAGICHRGRHRRLSRWQRRHCSPAGSPRRSSLPFGPSRATPAQVCT